MIAECDWGTGNFVLWTGLHEKDLVKQVPGAQWKSNFVFGNRGPGAWVCPATWPAYIAINGIFGWNLQPEPTYTEWGQWAWDNRYHYLSWIRFQPDVPTTGPTAEKLWPLQRVAVQAMAFAERYAEMDEMGGGKTVTTLATVRALLAMHGPEAVFPMLVICPNKVRRSWRKIALESMGAGQGPLWADLRLEVMPKGKPAQRKLLERFTNPDIPSDQRPQVLVTNWESIAGLSRHERFGDIELKEAEKTPGPLNYVGWQTVVADEAHRIKDRRAKQTRALKAIAFGTPAVNTWPARFRFALTGTPVSNNSAEAWSIMNFLDEVAFPAYSRFVERYSTQVFNGFGGMDIGGIKPENQAEFHAMFDPFGIRRLREQFDPFKPHLLEQTLTAPMETAQQRAYDQMAKEMLAELEDGVLTATASMTKSQRLHQLAQAYGGMEDRGRRDPNSGEPLLDLQLRAPSNKVKVMMELIDELGIGPGMLASRSVVFGAQSRQLIALCEEALIKAKIPYALYVGGMTDQAQEHNERLFESGAAKVALCTIEAAKEGLNSLVQASTLVFLQKSWSQTANKQFQGRVDRPGQQASSVAILDVVSEGTLEEFDQIEKLSAKFENFQQVVADARTLALMLKYKGEAR